MAPVWGKLKSGIQLFLAIPYFLHVTIIPQTILVFISVFADTHFREMCATNELYVRRPMDSGGRYHEHSSSRRDVAEPNRSLMEQ